MKAFVTALLALLAAGLPLAARGDIIYNVTFEDPPHINGQSIVTGIGSDRPISADNTTAATGIADFSSQVALSANGGMSFYPSSPSVTGIVNISWDFAMISYSEGITTEAGLSIYAVSDNPIFRLLYFDDDNVEFSASALGIGPTNIMTVSLGLHDRYLLSADLDAATYSFYLNGVPLLASVDMGVENSVKYVTFDNYQISSPTYAVDNFRWEIVPEPSTLLLISLGLLGVCGRRFAGRRTAGR